MGLDVAVADLRGLFGANCFWFVGLCVAVWCCCFACFRFWLTVGWGLILMVFWVWLGWFVLVVV